MGRRDRRARHGRRHRDPSWPELGLATLAIFFAISMLVRGIVTIVIGFRLRSLRNADTGPAEQTATFA